MDDVIALVDRLSVNKKLSVWSVIISFFGDAIVPRGGAVSASSVQQVMGRIGFEAGAVRTAFSRLTGDGWVVREKIGRASFYRLSEAGLSPFEDATTRIYAPKQKPMGPGGAWTLAIKNSKPHQRHLLYEANQATLDGLAENDFLILTGNIDHMPQWFRSEIAPRKLGAAFSQLIRDFSPVAKTNLSDLDSLAVRCLLIHEWRKLILPTERVPIELLPIDWPEEPAHTFVASFYHALLPSSENWLNTIGTGPEGSLPIAEPDVTLRFS